MLPILAPILFLIALGDVAAAALAVPVPGSVLGMLAAAVYLSSRGTRAPAMGSMFDALIPFAPMLFVPAGAGVVTNIELVVESWLPIVAVITLGTAGAILATGLIAQFLLQRLARTETVS